MIGRDQGSARRVTVIYKSLPRYRIPFFEAVRPRLGAAGIELALVYGQPSPEEATKGDVGEIEWAQYVESSILRLGNRELYWQPCLEHVSGSDLVIVEQASKLLLNYVLLAGQRLGGPKLAFWDHGRNLRTHAASRSGEAVKRLMSTRVHWWFAYTEGSARIIHELGYPKDRITVVQNSIDVEALRQARAAAEAAGGRLHPATEPPTAVYAGGLYPEKRVDFLLAAARAIRARVRDFELTIIGGGPDENRCREAARAEGWIHYRGPVFGPAKVEEFRRARVMLMPGLVGLGIVDSFALEVPMVTVDLPFHSPEIEYLEHGANGLLLPGDSTPEEYGAAVADLLEDPDRLEHLREGCRQAASRYTLAAMVERFATGVEAALGP